MRRLGRFLGLCAALASGLASAQDASLQDVRLWAAPERTRVVFDMNQSFEHEVFSLDNPARVVIDLPDTARAQSLAKSFEGKGVVGRVRTGIRNGDDLRVVLDLSQQVPPHSFTLTPEGDYGHRLVIDLEGAEAGRTETTASASSGVGSADKTPERADPEAAQSRFGQRELVIAVDAGHGGEDPGAVGPSGTHEKDVVLKIARRLAGMIDAEPGMRAVLVRDGDYYLGLRERIEKAREAQADLFLSVHADAFRDRRARGSSVYVLSRSGASSEHARWLAERENSADLIGGVSLRDKDKDLASFMLDLSQGASIEASLDAGARVLDQIGQINDLHKGEVQQAGFLVLKSPDIPSMLVETAFISNPAEERELTTSSHQRKLARAMLQGIRGYFASYRPPGTSVATAHKHEVRRGQTLSEIAVRYGVSVAAVRRVNDLDSDVIQVGDTLMIPPPGESRLASSSP